MAWQDFEELFIPRCILRKLQSNGQKRRRLPSRRRQRVKSNLIRAQMPDEEDVREAQAALSAMRKVTQINETDLVQTLPDQDEGPVVSNGWNQLLKRIEQNHAWRVQSELGRETVLEPVYPNIDVQQQFLDSCKKLDHNLAVTYHGTKSHNISPIQEKGLLIPGHGGVKVVNGSAHGVGIYTAKFGSATLSKGFCDSDTMFICAVCDTSEPSEPLELESFAPSMTHVQTRFPKYYTFQGRKIGNHQLKQESKEIRHVGDAVVVFQEECIVPVFTATVKAKAQMVTAADAYTLDEPESWVLGPVQVGRRQFVVPEGANGLIKFGSVASGRSGRTVWLPANMPRKDATAHERSLQRRLRRKERKHERHGEQQAKHQFDGRVIA